MESIPFSLLVFIFFFPILSSIHGKCLNDQRSHLLQFRDGLQFDPTHSNKLVHWNQSTDCCKWGGIACDRLGHVIGLELFNESISNRNEGWKTLFSLQHLEKLNLAWNDFHPDTIPTELCNLARLKYLDFSYSGFIGQIPIGLSKMNRLVTLDLTDLDLNHDPHQVKNPGGLEVLFQNLTELRELYLDGVNISAQGSDWCNAFSSLSKLQVLSLRNCYLSGPIFSSFSKLASLTTIQLDGNNLSTIVPYFFANFTNLMILSLVKCDLHGHFPEKIFQIPTLESLDLSYNDLLGGNLPQFDSNGSLKEIIVSFTNFSGSLPDSIGNLGALSRLDLSKCNFNGAIPTTLANLSELVYLDLSGNKFNGSVPSFQMSKKLVYIDLFGNNFTGPISFAHFEGLVGLAYVNLGYNSLSGSFPSSLFSLPSLQKLLLSHNHFDSQIQEFQNASSSLIEELDLSNNYFGGFIPKFFFDLQWLVVLDLSFNSFKGTLRLDMFNRLQNLARLDLSYNNLSIDASCSTSMCLSSFPQLHTLNLASCNLKMFPDLKNQTELMHLDLSLNNITGEIPNWIWNIGLGSLSHLNLSFNLLEDIQKPYTFPDFLLVLDLHANLLKGEIPIPPNEVAYLDYSKNNFNISIPPIIGDNITLCIFLSLSHNNITGDIPESICNATFIKVLDLSNNFLRGRIPACLFAMTENLGVLNLGGNKLYGLIPDTFHDKCGLRTLDLSRNNLEGKIPISLASCNFLEALNVGNNYIEDNFPCTLTNGPNLTVLILRSNRFHGEISCSWDDHSWPSLHIMDIAYNNFSGALPPELFLNCRGMMIDDSIKAPPLQYVVFERSNLYYQDSVKLVIKGLELELVKILTIYKTMDFSCNKFQGKIPDAVGGLTELYILNLSHNALTGTIPGSIGKLAQLGSLDLSRNQLTGMIPLGLGDLTFLSFLNLSYNQLIGKIPGGSQIQTFSESSFLGNKGLCGLPWNLSCDDLRNNNGSSSPTSPFDMHTDNNETDWVYISAAMGFSVGLGIISLLNFFSSKWWERFNALILQFLLLRVLRLQVQQRLYRNPIRRL